jgi:transcriptional regulator of acetoin/glycerol metabolism
MRSFVSVSDGSRLRCLDEIVEEYVLLVLRKTEWNMCDAAKALGIDRRTLYRKLARWGIDVAASRAAVEDVLP